MTWNYLPQSTLALTSNKDQVRIIIGDTDKKEQLLQDEEINLIIDLKAAGETVDQTIITNAAIYCLGALVAKFSRLGKIKIGDISSDGSTIAAQFRKRIEDLEEEKSSGSFALPIFGGLSLAEKQDLSADSDGVQPFFSRAMKEDPVWYNWAI